MKEKIKIFLQNGFVYSGEKLDEDQIFITIFDEVKQKKMMIAKAKIETIEITKEAKENGNNL